MSNLFEEIARGAVANVGSPAARPDAQPEGAAASFEDIARGAIPGAASPPTAQAQPTQNGWGPVLGNALLQGGAAVAGLPGDLQGMLERHAILPLFNLASRAVGGQGNYQLRPPILTTDSITQAGREAGIIDRPGTEPTSDAQRYVAAGVRGGAQALPFAIANPPAAVAQLASGIFGGVGAEAGGDAASYAGAGPGGQAAARFAGGLAGGIGGAAVASGGQRIANAARGRGAEAYDQAGVSPRMVADATPDGNVRRLTATVAQMPGGAGRVTEAAASAIEDFGAAVNRAASRVSSAATPQQAGEAMQQGARQWLARWKADQGEAWDNFFALVPGARSPLTNTRRALGEMQPTALADDGPAMARVLEDPFLQRLASAVGRTPELGVDALKQARSRIGALIEQNSFVGDIDAGMLKRLYGALTDDIRGLATASGGRPALEAFDRASRLTRDGHALLDGTVSRILGSPARPATPEAAYQWVMGEARGGGSRLGGVRQAVGDDAFNEGAGVRLRQMGAPEMGITANTYPTTTYSRQYRQMAPEARAELFRDIPQAAPLAEVADRSAQAARYANTSNTGSVGQFAPLVAAPAGVLAGSIGGATVGQPVIGAAVGSVVLPVMTMAVANLFARALTSPSIARMAMAPGSPLGPEGRRALTAILQSNDPALRNAALASLQGGQQPAQ